MFFLQCIEIKLNVPEYASRCCSKFCIKWLSVLDCSSGMWLGRKHGAPGGCCAARLHRKPNPSGKEPPEKENPPTPALCASPLTPAPGPDWCGWRSDSRPSRSVMANPLDLNPDPLRRDLSSPNDGYSFSLGFSSVVSSLPVMLAACLIWGRADGLSALAGQFISRGSLHGPIRFNCRYVYHERRFPFSITKD